MINKTKLIEQFHRLLYYINTPKTNPFHSPGYFVNPHNFSNILKTQKDLIIQKKLHSCHIIFNAAKNQQSKYTRTAGLDFIRFENYQNACCPYNLMIMINPDSVVNNERFVTFIGSPNQYGETPYTVPSDSQLIGYTLKMDKTNRITVKEHYGFFSQTYRYNYHTGYHRQVFKTTNTFRSRRNMNITFKDFCTNFNTNLHNVLSELIYLSI